MKFLLAVDIDPNIGSGRGRRARETGAMPLAVSARKAPDFAQRKPAPAAGHPQCL